MLCMTIPVVILKQKIAKHDTLNSYIKTEIQKKSYQKYGL